MCATRVQMDVRRAPYTMTGVSTGWRLQDYDHVE